MVCPFVQYSVCTPVPSPTKCFENQALKRLRVHVLPAAGAEGVGGIGADVEEGDGGGSSRGLFSLSPSQEIGGPCRSRIYREFYIAAQDTEYVCGCSGATVSDCRARRVLPSLEDFGKFGERPDRAANVCGGCDRE